MCGRITLTLSAREIAAAFDLADDAAPLAGPDGSPLRPRFNIAPTQLVLTVDQGDGAERGFAWRRWGLVPAWAKDPSIGNKLFNARGETVAEKPSLRSAFKRRRCLVVAGGFYEWSPQESGHVPHWFHPSKGGLLAFAGLFERWSIGEGPAIDSCTIVTTEASSDLAGIHHRMPVLLAPDVWDPWLDPGTEIAQVKALIGSAPDGTHASS